MADELRPADEPQVIADRCPYSRSFTPRFAHDPACPAYQATTFTVLDTAHQPLGAALTCRHLVIGSHPSRAGRYYPRCGLGTAADRLNWVATVTPARLSVMRSLEEEFAELTEDDRALLLEARARAFAEDAPDEAIEQLEVQLSTFLDRVDAFFDERADRLADIGLPAAQLKELVAEWSITWLRDPGPSSAAVLERGIPGLVPATAALLGVELPAVAPAAHEQLAVSQAGALVIDRSEDPRTLWLRGDVDVSNSDAVGTALADALADGADVLVDFGGVLFCDLSGLRAVVRAAQSAAPGQRITVAHLPAHLRRAVRMVGWSDLPGLVVGGDGDGGGV